MRVTVRRTPEPLEPAARRGASRRRREAAPERRPRATDGCVRVEAPMVGVFYRAPQPGAPPFVEEGDTVGAGQTLCILEAMKLMNEIKAEPRGRPRRSTSRTPSRSSSASSCSSSSRLAPAAARRGLADVQARARRQPRRGRRPRDPRAARARHRGGRRLLDRRPRLAPRPARRPRGPHRPAAGDRELPQIPSVVAAANTTGCEAVHPGWGFLAENPAFVAACADNDLVFVGPSAEVMARMGDKVQAKAELRAADVPLVPGTEGATTLDEARDGRRRARLPGPAEGRRPAAAGKGMRLVEAPTSSRSRSATPLAEAQAAFGDGSALPREGGRARAARRDPGARRRAGRRAHARRARVLDPAPPPEADRGVARRRRSTPRRARRWRPPPSAPAARSATATRAPSSSCSGPTARSTSSS